MVVSGKLLRLQGESDLEFALLIVMPHEVAFKQYYDLQTKMSSGMNFHSNLVIFAACSVTILSIGGSFYFARRIASPLQELANITKQFTNPDRRMTSLSTKKSFEDIKTSDPDIEELIKSFRKLVKDLTGFKKGTRKEKPNDDIILYPVSNQEGLGDDFEMSVGYLLNFDDFRQRLHVYA